MFVKRWLLSLIFVLLFKIVYKLPNKKTTVRKLVKILQYDMVRTRFTSSANSKSNQFQWKVELNLGILKGWMFEKKYTWQLIFPVVFFDKQNLNKGINFSQRYIDDKKITEYFDWKVWLTQICPSSEHIILLV